MKTITIYESRDAVRFQRRGKLLTGTVLAKWAKGEGDGYAIETTEGEVYDIHAKNVVGLAQGALR